MRTKRFTFAIFLVFVIWVALQFHTSGPNNLLDPIIFGVIGGTYFTIALVMVIGTQSFSARAMGLLLSASATAILYCYLVWLRIHHSITPNEPIIDIGRALYLASSPLLIFGVYTWIRVNWRVVRHSDEDPIPDILPDPHIPNEE